MFSRRSLVVILLIGIFSGSAPEVFAKHSEIPSLQLYPIQESEAFQKYMRGPKTEYAKVAYLIERASKMDVDIDYDGYHYTSRVAAAIARQFLALNFHNGETARIWIMKYGNRTFLSNGLIWVSFTNKSGRWLGRDVLTSELEALEKAEKESQAAL